MNEQAFFSLVPENWDCHNKSLYGKNREVFLHSGSSEYEEIERLFSKYHLKVDRIKRLEHVYKYMMFLVRQQHLIKLNPGTTYYKVRRFVRLYDEDLDMAVKHHLDMRRVSSVEFRSVPSHGSGNVVLITSVITSTPETDHYIPDRDSNYVIEYIVYLE